MTLRAHDPLHLTSLKRTRKLRAVVPSPFPKRRQILPQSRRERLRKIYGELKDLNLHFGLLILYRSQLVTVNDKLTEVISTLQKSSIVPREPPDNSTRFWKIHKKYADEYDDEFHTKYSGRMDNSTIIVRPAYDL